MEQGGVTEAFLAYIEGVRRYSPKTLENYSRVLESFRDYVDADDDAGLLRAMDSSVIRGYEVFLMEKKGLGAKSVNMYLSALSSFCRYLMKCSLISSNPVRSISKPRVPRRLPVFYREESMERYFRENTPCGEDLPYAQVLAFTCIAVLSLSGIRRAELIDLKREDYHASRRILRVKGKGDKMREVPLSQYLCEKISLYLHKVDNIGLGTGSAKDPLFMTAKGCALYPVALDRIVKQELGKVGDITLRKSPHALRHTYATFLLDNGADIYSIKELLGHSSLAATQIYTHNDIEKLKKVYNSAHPRAIKNGGKNGNQD